MSELAVEQLNTLTRQLKNDSSQVASSLYYEAVILSLANNCLSRLEQKLQSKDKDFAEELLPLQGCKPVKCLEFVIKRKQQVTKSIGCRLNKVRTIHNEKELDEWINELIDIFFLVECIASNLAEVKLFDAVNETLPKQFEILDALDDAARVMGLSAETPVNPRLKLAIKGQVLHYLFESNTKEKSVSRNWEEFVSSIKPVEDAIILDSRKAYREFAVKIAEVILRNPDLGSIERAEELKQLFDHAVLTGVWMPDYNPKSELWLAAAVYCAELSENEFDRNRYTAEGLAEELLYFMNNNSIMANYKYRTPLGLKVLETGNTVSKILTMHPTEAEKVLDSAREKLLHGESN